MKNETEHSAPISVKPTVAWPFPTPEVPRKEFNNAHDESANNTHSEQAKEEQARLRRADVEWQREGMIKAEIERLERSRRVLRNIGIALVVTALLAALIYFCISFPIWGAIVIAILIGFAFIFWANNR